MSSTLLGEIWSLPIGKTGKLLLAYIADGCDHTGSGPSHETADLAAMAGIAPKTARRALTELSGPGYLVRGSDRWTVNPYPGEQPPATAEPMITAQDIAADVVAATEPSPGPQASNHPEPQPAEQAPVETIPPSEARLQEFCAAWGLLGANTEIDQAWATLENAEGKFNRTEKHRDGEDKWTVTIESMAELHPAILHAVAVFRIRQAAGRPVHAATPQEFIDKQLWLAPDYQVSVETATSPPVEINEGELDALVMEMNRQGGAFSCHLRSSMKDQETGELLEETLPMYAKRVNAKYNDFLSKRDYFRD